MERGGRRDRSWIEKQSVCVFFWGGGGGRGRRGEERNKRLRGIRIGGNESFGVALAAVQFGLIFWGVGGGEGGAGLTEVR